MEFTNTPRDVPPHRPVPGGAPQPMPQRRVFSDFAPRPNLRPTVPQSPTRPSSPISPTPVAVPHPVSPQPRPQPVPTPTPTPTPSTNLQAPPLQLSQQETDKSSASRPRTKSTHAGLVGFICFVLFALLLLSPLLPGKILDNFPGSSQSSSTGDQTIACIHDVTSSSSSLAYNTKAGSPIVYNYTATTTQTGLCDGQQKTAVEGRTSQFNPLGLSTDLLLALLVAVGISQVWRLAFKAKG